jgi:hypothetical protein
MPSPTPPDDLSPDALRDFYVENHDLLAASRDTRLVLQRYTAHLQQYTHGYGLTLLQYTVLMILATQLDESLTVGELAQRLSLTHSACVQVLNRMEAKGLTQRVEAARIPYPASQVTPRRYAELLIESQRAVERCKRAEQRAG